MLAPFDSFHVNAGLRAQQVSQTRKAPFGMFRQKDKNIRAPFLRRGGWWHAGGLDQQLFHWMGREPVPLDMCVHSNESIITS